MKILTLIFAIISLTLNVVANNSTFQNDTILSQIQIWDSIGPGSDTLSIKEEIIIRPLTGVCTRDWAIDKITVTTITPVVPANPNGSAFIICPGGAFARVVYDVEGLDIGRWLNTLGITAFVLKYRLPSNDHIDKKNVPLQDAQRAIRYVKANAEKWSLDTSKIGIAGASAGGHVAATLATSFNKNVYDPIDSLDSISARPYYMFLLYPVISMEDNITHALTKEYLLGKSPSQPLVDEFSAEKNVTSDSPISFFALCQDDNGVDPENSELMHQALQNAGVSSEIHIFKNGGHGRGICKAVGYDFENWPDYCTNWLHSNELTEDSVIITVISNPSTYENSINIFPNPVNINTVLNYSINNKSLVKIELYDHTGKLVEELVNEVREKGDYNIYLNKYINKLNGIYIVRFQCGKELIRNKIIF